MFFVKIIVSVITNNCFHQTCFHCNLAFLCLLCFPSLKNGLLTAILPLRPFLIRLHGTIDGSTKEPDASLRSCVRFLFCFFGALFIVFRYCSSAVVFFFFFKPASSSFYLLLSSFLMCFRDTLYTMLSANSSF